MEKFSVTRRTISVTGPPAPSHGTQKTHKMTPKTLTQDLPNTLLLGLWSATNNASVRASLRNECGELVQEVGEWGASAAWVALATALEELRLTGVRNLVLFTNAQEVYQALRRKAAPEPTESVVHRLGYRESVTVPCGGNEAHWAALRLLGGHYRWSVKYVEREAEDMAVTVREESTVTTRQLEDTKKRAQDLLQAAYAPQPIKQADGSMLDLCWEGRLHRAYAMANGEVDPKRREVIKQAIDRIDGMAKAACAAAENAASEYGSLCARAGQPMADVYPKACQCAGCVEAKTITALYEAESALWRAQAALMMPDDHIVGLPILCDLLDAGRNDEIMARLQTIAEAQRAYGKACQERGQTPAWMKIFELVIEVNDASNNPNPAK